GRGSGGRPGVQLPGVCGRTRRAEAGGGPRRGPWPRRAGRRAAVSLIHYLVLAGILFTIGAVTVLVRRNALVAFMGVELMLNAANLTLDLRPHARRPARAGTGILRHGRGRGRGRHRP